MCRTRRGGHAVPKRRPRPERHPACRVAPGPAVGAVPQGRAGADVESLRVRRVLAVGLLTAAVWVLVFMFVWRSTGITDRPCNDTVTIPVAAACAAPGPSVFPALPLATMAAAAVGMAAGRWARSSREGESDPQPAPA